MLCKFPDPLLIHLALCRALPRGRHMHNPHQVKHVSLESLEPRCAELYSYHQEVESLSATLPSLCSNYPLGEPGQLNPTFGAASFCSWQHKIICASFVSSLIFQSMLYCLQSLFHSSHRLFPTCSLQKNIEVFVRGCMQKQHSAKLCQVLTQMVQKVKRHCETLRLSVMLKYHYSLGPELI